MIFLLPLSACSFTPPYLFTQCLLNTLDELSNFPKRWDYSSEQERFLSSWGIYEMNDIIFPVCSDLIQCFDDLPLSFSCISGSGHCPLSQLHKHPRYTGKEIQGATLSDRLDWKAMLLLGSQLFSSGGAHMLLCSSCCHFLGGLHLWSSRPVYDWVGWVA